MTQPSSNENSSASLIGSDEDQLNREIEEALGGQSIEDLMLQDEQTAPGSDQIVDSVEYAAAQASARSNPASDQPIHHDMCRGSVSAIRGEDVFVDLDGPGNKLQGLVPLVQFDRAPQLGAVMDFVVDNVDEAQGLVFLSREGAISRATWQQLHLGSVVEARVTGKNKGGLELEMVGGIGAFMPASQIDIYHVDDLEALVGQNLEGMVQEINTKSKSVVLSRRQWLEHKQEKAREKLLAQIEEGQVREGIVSRIMDFGAFVDLGGMDGLLHISDMSYSHAGSPKEIVEVGQKVSVKVLKIEIERNRISLGLKQIQPDPWMTVDGRIKAGDPVAGKIVKTGRFGAFVQIEPGIDALLPLSEMSWKRIHKAEQAVQKDDNLHMVVLSVEPDKKHITVSLKQATGDPWIGAERKYEKGSWVDGTVEGITEFGAFVELETGVEGLVHISELDDKRVKKVEDVVKIGEQKQFRVLEISEEDRKVSLSLKKEDEQKLQEQLAASSAGKPKAQKRDRKDLKGGMDVGGVGLGGLSLDNLK